MAIQGQYRINRVCRKNFFWGQGVGCEVSVVHSKLGDTSS